MRRSEQKVKDTFAKAHDSAEGQYDDESRAARTAGAAVKHTDEEVGDYWEPKGGVDANASKEHLYEQAQKMNIPGRSDMTTDELVDALRRANDRATEQSRND